MLKVNNIKELKYRENEEEEQNIKFCICKTKYSNEIERYSLGYVGWVIYMNIKIRKVDIVEYRVVRTWLESQSDNKV